MTNPTDFDAAEPSIGQRLFRWAQIAIASLLFIFVLGVATGSTVAMLEDETIRLKAVLIPAASILICAACAWWLWKLKPIAGNDEPVSPRTRNARRYMAMSIVFGMIIGATLSLSALSSGGLDGVRDVFGNGSLPSAPTIAIAIAYALFLPIAGWLHLRSIDEHDAKANYEGAMAGIYAYSTITPTWWLLYRAGVVPQVDAMAVFLIVMVIWGIVWLVRRGI